MAGLLVSTFLTGCPAGSSGQITNEQADNLDFVDEKQVVFVETDGGLIRIQVDGTEKRKIYGSEYSFQAVASDQSLWALGDSESNLFLMYGPGGELHRVSQLDKRSSSVAISPDGLRVAVSRHANFDLAQSARINDDRIYLIDAQSREVTQLKPTSAEWLTRLDWSKDGTALYGSSHDRNFRIDPLSNARETLATFPVDDTHVTRKAPRECAATGARLVMRNDEGVDIHRGEDEVERLVVIEGRERGFHDYQASVGNFFFTESCNYVVFVFDGAVWLADVKTKVVGRLIEGGRTWRF
ncbi:MAG: hypothetical protein H0U74_23340 [Bradymonadaceae bacterium]|nr:hypothetical protein [Lujinxingiaceae bacterium]